MSMKGIASKINPISLGGEWQNSPGKSSFFRGELHFSRGKFNFPRHAPEPVSAGRLPIRTGPGPGRPGCGARAKKEVSAGEEPGSISGETTGAEGIRQFSKETAVDGVAPPRKRRGEEAAHGTSGGRFSGRDKRGLADGRAAPCQLLRGSATLKRRVFGAEWFGLGIHRENLAIWRLAILVFGDWKFGSESWRGAAAINSIAKYRNRQSPNRQIKKPRTRDAHPRLLKW